MDGSLVRAAADLASMQASGSALSSDQVTFLVRAHGGPYVWVRAWALLGEQEESEIQSGLAEWLEASSELGERRCGIGRVVTAEGIPSMAALSAGVLADLEPVPTRCEVGRALSIKARFLEPVDEARVVVLGPRGAPREVAVSLRGKDISATFRADRPGRWLIQLLATVTGGPRPVLEAETYAGVAPPKVFHSEPVPGEAAARGKTGKAALASMLNEARKSEGRQALKSLSVLDRLAQEHAEAMRDKARLSHDLDAGSADRRVEAAGVRSHRTGENIAMADNVERAHRALWASPSHRGNLLERGFSAVGVGVATGEKGRVWVVQLFADPF